MIAPFQVFRDCAGVGWIAVRELPQGFFWLCLRASWVPELKLFSVANLRRMTLIGEVKLDASAHA